MRILFDIDQKTTVAKLLDHKIRRVAGNCLLAGEVSKGLAESSVGAERRDSHQIFFLAELVVDISATGRDVDDPRALAGNDRRTPLGISPAVDHAVTADGRGSIVRERARGSGVPAYTKFRRIAARHLLCFEPVEWPLVSPAEHFLALDHSLDRITSLLLEHLRDRLELRRTGRPLPFGAAEPFLELTRQSSEFQVVFGEVVHRAVAFGLQTHVVQFQVDRGGNVARERPGRCRPDQQILVLPILQRKTDEQRTVYGQLAPVRHFHLTVGATGAPRPGHHVRSAVDLPTIEALLQKRPDRVVVLGRKREVAAAPFGVAQASGQLMRRPGHTLLGRSRDRHRFGAAQRLGQLP